MRFTMFVTNAETPNAEPWKEPEDRDLTKSDGGFPETAEGARQWAEFIVARFNATLRPGERARKLVRIEVTGEGSSRHAWRKVSLVTERGGGRYYDRYACERCGVTGKRFGLGADVIRDPKFKAKKYETCTPK